MRANKRFLFTVGIIGIWTILTYFVVVRHQPDYQNGKSKFREKIEHLEKEVEKESKNREQIVRQYKNLIEIIKLKTTTSSAAPVNQESNLALLDDDTNNNNNNHIQLNNKIDFNGKYVDDDPNMPVIPVIVFACNRVSVSRNLDALIKYRPSREQFPIVVSQVCARLSRFSHSIINSMILVGLRR